MAYPFDYFWLSIREDFALLALFRTRRVNQCCSALFPNENCETMIGESAEGAPVSKVAIHCPKEAKQRIRKGWYARWRNRQPNSLPISHGESGAKCLFDLGD